MAFIKTTLAIIKTPQAIEVSAGTAPTFLRDVSNFMSGLLELSFGGQIHICSGKKAALPLDRKHYLPYFCLTTPIQNGTIHS